MRFLLLLLTFTFFVMANIDVYPKKECGLFNNLKHTKNRGDLVLKMHRSYEMLKHHKGQYLLKVEYATPSQRWVDDDCLSLRPLRGTPMYENMKNSSSKTPVNNTVNIEDEISQATVNMGKQVKSKQNLLALSWHNAFCETHRYKKECKRNLSDLLGSRKHEEEFVLHGLWPQPRNNVYCDVDSELISVDKNKGWRDLPCLALDEKVEEKLEIAMPGFASGLHKHEWAKHGTCYGTDVNTYYEDSISLLEQVNDSALAKLFKDNIGKRISLKELRRVTDKTFGKGAGNRVALQCKGGLVTELWLQLGSGSKDLGVLLKKGKKMYSRCKGGRIDKAGFTKETGAKAGFGR